MGVIIPVGYGQVTVKMRQASLARQAMCTWGYEAPVGLDLDVQATAVRAILTAAGRLWAPARYVNGWALEQVQLTVNTVSGIFSGEDNTSTPGTLSGEAAPPQVAILIKKNSTLGGRAGRGRMYLPSSHISETNITQQGTISSGELTALRNTATSTLDDLNASDWPVRLLHSTGSPGPNAVTQWTVQQVVATQRRRIRQ